jgi:two-component system nitrate/nitrite response regulator NarL
VTPRTDGSLHAKGAAASSTIAVCLVADVALHREGISRLIEGEERIRLVGVAAPGENEVMELGDQIPEVALLDMPPAEARSLARALRHTAPDVKLIALLVPEVEEEVIACAEAGICGYVPPDAGAAELVCTIERVADDELVCSARIASSLMRRVGTLASGQAEPVTLLTPREREIVALIAQGRSNKEIGSQLYIEQPTVKSHIHSIFEKLGVHRRGEAAALLTGSQAPTPFRTIRTHSQG